MGLFNGMKIPICNFPFESVQEKGDPEEFDEDTKEWIQVILGFIEIEFEIPLHLHVTFDATHFNRYSVKESKIKIKQDYARVDKSSGLIYINPKLHATDSKTQLLNTLVHESLHIKFPDWSESKIIKVTNILVRYRHAD